MGTSTTKLGADHLFTLTNMASLAATYLKQGWWDEAEEPEVQVIEKRKTKLGADYPGTVTSMVALAFIQKEYGRGTEALKPIEEYLKAETWILSSTPLYFVFLYNIIK